MVEHCESTQRRTDRKINRAGCQRRSQERKIARAGRGTDGLPGLRSSLPIRRISAIRNRDEFRQGSSFAVLLIAVKH
jgi:hypothetical protein